MPRAGITISDATASPIPRQLVSGWSRAIRVVTASQAMYGASRKKVTATAFCARASAVSDRVREPVRSRKYYRQDDCCGDE